MSSKSVLYYVLRYLGSWFKCVFPKSGDQHCICWLHDIQYRFNIELDIRIQSSKRKHDKTKLLLIIQQLFGAEPDIKDWMKEIGWS